MALVREAQGRRGAGAYPGVLHDAEVAVVPSVRAERAWEQGGQVHGLLVRLQTPRNRVSLVDFDPAHNIRLSAISCPSRDLNYVCAPYLAVYLELFHARHIRVVEASWPCPCRNKSLFKNCPLKGPSALPNVQLVATRFLRMKMPQGHSRGFEAYCLVAGHSTGWRTSPYEVDEALAVCFDACKNARWSRSARCLHDLSIGYLSIRDQIWQAGLAQRILCLQSWRHANCQQKIKFFQSSNCIYCTDRTCICSRFVLQHTDVKALRFVPMFPIGRGQNSH